MVYDSWNRRGIFLVGVKEKVSKSENFYYLKLLIQFFLYFIKFCNMQVGFDINFFLLYQVKLMCSYCIKYDVDEVLDLYYGGLVGFEKVCE